jgi:hypothetical protein
VERHGGAGQPPDRIAQRLEPGREKRLPLARLFMPDAARPVGQPHEAGIEPAMRRDPRDAQPVMGLVVKEARIDPAEAGAAGRPRDRARIDDSDRPVRLVVVEKIHKIASDKSGPTGD